MTGMEELLGRTLVVVAHPDDEAIGCGVLLQRMRDPLVVFATDGAPRQAKWWQKYGSREAYAELRRQEACQALGEIGASAPEFLGDDDCQCFADQQLFQRLPEAVAALTRLVERFRPQALLTHTYEGGHPDHDTCCFVATQVAARSGLPAWEMPLYRRDPEGNVVQQQFIHEQGGEVTIEGSIAEQQRKQRMLQAYRSQEEITSAFDTSLERLRPLHHYDFSRPPHAGKLNYEHWAWEMTGQQLCGAFAEFEKYILSESVTST
jgi:LmbE family N-acetylglucosaminyl deacetylase